MTLKSKNNRRCFRNPIKISYSLFLSILQYKNFIFCLLDNHYIEQLRAMSRQVTKQAHNTPQFRSLKRMTIMILILLASLLWFWPHYQITPSVCLYDGFHRATSSANSLFQTNEPFRFVMMVGGQMLIDASLMGIFAIFIVKFRNFTPIVWAVCFYALRGFLLNIYKMPFPQGMFWAGQGIPTVGVAYQFTRDFFYSGHTGFMVYSLRTWSSYNSRFMKIFSIIGLLQAIFLLIISRGHYIIDIFAGWVFSQWFSMVIFINLKQIDLAISQAIFAFVDVWKELGETAHKSKEIFYQQFRPQQ